MYMYVCIYIYIYNQYTLLKKQLFIVKRITILQKVINPWFVINILLKALLKNGKKIFVLRENQGDKIMYPIKG